jgi:FlaA1/EpsC-like NDP-sugar epimerase
LLKYKRQVLLLFMDIVGCLLAVLLAYLITANLNDYKSINAGMAYWTGISFVTVLVTIIVNNFFHLYDTLWEHASISEILKTVYSSLVSNTLFLPVVLIFPVTFLFKTWLTFLICYTAYLFASRSAFRLTETVNVTGRRTQYAASGRRILIVGAGTAGSMVLNEIKAHPNLGEAVALIDDDEAKQGSRIAGVRIEGMTKDIPRVCEAMRIDQIVVAIPSASSRQIRETLDLCTQTKCDLRIMPGLFELMNKQALLGQLREVRIEDLLGRDPVELDFTSVAAYIKGKTVLVTGGGGSIGSELCRQVAIFHPQKLVILDLYENTASQVPGAFIRRRNRLRTRPRPHRPGHGALPAGSRFPRRSAQACAAHGVQPHGGCEEQRVRHA